MKSARHKARELALQGLYQWLLAEEHADEIRAHLAEFKGYDKADRNYLDLLLNGVIAAQNDPGNWMPFFIGGSWDKPFVTLVPLPK